MKHLKTLSILVLSSVLLMTGCSKKLSEDKFKEVLQSVTDTVNAGTEVTNVHIKDNAQYTYDYKEGEFFRYHSFALLILVPVTDTVCTWEEDGKYYHYKKSVLENVDKEITEEQFNVYMATARGEICAKLNEGIMECENLLREEPELYTDVKNAFYQTAKGEYRLNSTMLYKTNDNGEEVTKQRKVIFLMKKNLPIKYTVKTDSDSTTSYTYGNAKFSKPEHNPQ